MCVLCIGTRIIDRIQVKSRMLSTQAEDFLEQRSASFLVLLSTFPILCIVLMISAPPCLYPTMQMTTHCCISFLTPAPNATSSVHQANGMANYVKRRNIPHVRSQGYFLQRVAKVQRSHAENTLWFRLKRPRPLLKQKQRLLQSIPHHNHIHLYSAGRV